MDRPFKQQFATRSVVMAARGIAATSHPLATQIAVQILRQDGSAVDAAIAAFQQSFSDLRSDGLI